MIELARQYIHLGKFDAAVSALRRTVSSRDDPEAHLLLGEVLLEANEMEAAAKSLRAAIAAAKKAVDEAPAPLAADGGEEGDGEGEEAVAGDSAVERAKATYETVEGRVRELLANVH